MTRARRDEADGRGIPGLLGPGDLTLDRVGPDAFDPTDLGSIVTIRWLVRAGSLSGAVRLWVPESMVQLWIASNAVTRAGEQQRTEQARTTEHQRSERDDGSSRRACWDVARGGGVRVDAAGTAAPAGRGGAAAFRDSLIGSPRNPTGPVDLIIDLDEQDVRFRIPTRPVADTGGHLLRLEAGCHAERRTRDPIDKTKLSRTAMSQPTDSHSATAAFRGCSARRAGHVDGRARAG